MNGRDLVLLARTRSGLTQRQLGERVGMAQNAIARIENGRVHASFETIRDLVRGCGFEPEVSLARYDLSYAREIKSRLLLSPAERLKRGLELARAAQRLRRDAVLLDG